MFIQNLSLIGFMGSGKSTIGKMLADKLNFLFLDTDKLIEYIQGTTISEIFKQHGENFFREIESKVIKKIYNNKNCVFACGGGVFCTAENIEIIRENSFVVYLHMTEPEAYERLKDAKDRPLLLKEADLKQKIAQMMSVRKDIYKNNCDIEIEINRKSPDLIAQDIIDYLKMH